MTSNTFSGKPRGIHELAPMCVQVPEVMPHKCIYNCTRDALPHVTE